MKIIFAVIKSALVGGGIVGGCYGTYKFVESVKDVKDNEGINIFQSITDAYKTASSSGFSPSNASSVDLEMAAEGIQLLNNKDLVKSVADNMKEIKEILKDEQKLKIFMTMMKNCNTGKTKTNCKNLSTSLKLLTGTNIGGAGGGASGSGPTISIPKLNINLPFMQNVDEQKIRQVFSTANPETVVEYLETAQNLNSAKEALSKTVPAPLKDITEGAMDMVTSVYSWFKFKNHLKPESKTLTIA